MSTPRTIALDEAGSADVAATPALQVRAALQVLLIVAAVTVCLLALRRLESVVLVLILASAFAYVIAPLVQLARSPIRIAGRTRRLSRGAAIALIYVLIAGSLSAAAALVGPTATAQVNEIFTQAPRYTRSIVAWEHGWSRYYQRLRMPIELRQGIDQSVQAAKEAALGTIRASLLAFVGTLANLPWLVLVPVLAFFLLKDAASFRRGILIALPHRIQLRGHRLFEDLNASLAAYIRAQLLACAIVGGLCGLGFAAIGIPYPVLLGVLAGVLELIPLVGPLTLAIVAALVGALHAPVLALWAIGFLAVLRIVEDYVIYPRLIRCGIEVHPLAVIVAILAGAELDGVAGVFLAVPVAAIASVLYRHWMGWRVCDAVAEASLSQSDAYDPQPASDECHAPAA